MKYIPYVNETISEKTDVTKIINLEFWSSIVDDVRTNLQDLHQSREIPTQ